MSPAASERAPRTPAWVYSYREHGYAVIPDVLPIPALERVATDMHALYGAQLARRGVAGVRRAGERALLANMERLLATDRSLYLTTTRHAAKLASLQSLVVSEAVLALPRLLGMQAVTIPTAPVLHVMAETLRIEGGYHGVSTHQDWPVVQGALDAMTMWFPLFEVTARTFPLEVIPGSHRRGVWPGRITEQTAEIDPSSCADSDFVAVSVPRGSLLVFNGFVVHRSTRVDQCQGLRIAASMRYENSLEPTFVEREWPCTYLRTVRRENLHPGFPSAEQVRLALSS